MAGEHLDIIMVIRINDKNPENKRFYSLRVVIISYYYLSHLFIGLMDFMPWGGFVQVIWERYGHSPNLL